MDKYLNKIVTVKMDRPLGSNHPKHGFRYEINYGFIPGTKQADGEELDAYVIGPNKPLDEFTGTCIAYIERANDIGDPKLIVVSDEKKGVTDSEIMEAVNFQEKFFQSAVRRLERRYIVHTIIFNSDGKMLLLQRSLKDEVLAGYWDVPGGSLNENEDPKEGAIRETKEEAGIDVTGPRFLFEASKIDSIKNKEYVTKVFLARLTNTPEIILNQTEHEKYEWVDLAKIENYKVVDYLIDIKNRLAE